MKSVTRVAIAGGVLMAVGLAGDRLAQSQSTSTPFTEIAEVLQSPRCMNCHPAGDAPLQTDESKPHAQNVKRIFSDLGGSCTTCHQETSIPGENLPPAAPHWGMPPAETPMIFEGKTHAELCADLKDENENGHRTLDDLVHHVEHDPLILWAFNPGGDRTSPPMTHEAFVALMAEWVALEAPCPE